MTNLEIYSLAQDVISNITRDLNNGIYEQLNGNLSVGWVEQPQKFNAWAESAQPEEDNPDHKIVLFYELARLLYRDIEEFCEFAGSKLPDSSLTPLFGGSEIIPALPMSFTKEECVKNMFLAGLTWIYWHEFSHVMQEHGFIRSQFGEKLASSSRVEECVDYSTDDESTTKEPLAGRDAALSHVTELAADFEATHQTIFELLRHFLYRDPEELEGFDIDTLDVNDLVKSDYNPATLVDSIYLFVCGLSCIFYRFHGLRNLTLSNIPEGSHPHPIIRMEVHVPHIYEFFDLEANREMMKHGMTRQQLVSLCTNAANSAAVFWVTQKAKMEKFPHDFLLLGLLNRPDVADYFRVIISTWDEIEPAVRDIRRFGTELGLLRFTTAMRNHFSVSKLATAQADKRSSAPSHHR